MTSSLPSRAGHDTVPTPAASRVTRRAVAKGSAWSVPAVAIAAAAPAVAASRNPCPTSGSAAFSFNGDTNDVGTVQYTGLLPKFCIVSFSMFGGRGGGSSTYDLPRQVQGKMVYRGAADWQLTVVVAGAGVVVGSGQAAALGGWGYGSGGSSVAASGLSEGGYSSGGGGSAFYFGVVDPVATPTLEPLVVAGGGGGFGQGNFGPILTGRPTSGFAPQGVGGWNAIADYDGAGVSADGRGLEVWDPYHTPTDYVSYAEATTGLQLLLQGGKAAVGGTGGAAGAASVTDLDVKPAPGPLAGQVVHTVSGEAGQDNGLGNLGGGDGGSGARPDSSTVRIRAGGCGGGGYAGGGGGDAAAIGFTTSDGKDSYARAGAGGGAGSSFVAPTLPADLQIYDVVESHFPVGVTHPFPGRLVLTW